MFQSIVHIGGMILRKEQKVIVKCRGGFGSGGSGFGQIRCPSVENNLTDNPSVNRPLK
jgi:hypothetical protein